MDGTRISVELIANFVNAGASAQELVESYPHLTLGAVHDAISYYFDHKDELDREFDAGSLEKAIERGEIEIGEGGRVIFKDVVER